MKCILLIITIVTLASGAGKPNWNSAGDDLENLQGTWAVVSLEADGSKFPEAMLAGNRIIIKGDSFKSYSGGATYGGTVKIDASKTPKTIDLIFTEGPEKGNTALAIYELRGDNWTLCLSMGRSSRPTEFATKQGRGHALETLKREKQ